MNHIKLEISRLCKAFGGLKAADEVSFNIQSGTVVGLIGPNGSGKTTLFNCVTKLLKPDSGMVFLNGERIDQLPAFKIARRGIGRSFQEVRLFKDLTVEDNMAIAAMGTKIDSWRELSIDCLEQLKIAEKFPDKCETLSVGQQRLVEIAMCMMIGSDLMMLDEPAAGVNPVIMDQIAKYIDNARSQGQTFFVIEHDIPFIMDISDHIVVLNLGQVLMQGKPREVQEDERVLEAYLGRKTKY